MAQAPKAPPSLVLALGSCGSSTNGEGVLSVPSCWAAITSREALGMLINYCIMRREQDHCQGCGLQLPHHRGVPRNH